MDVRQKNRDEMLGTISNYYDEEKVSFTPYPKINSLFLEIKTIHREIGLNESILKEGLKGKVASKDDSQEEIIKTGLVFAGVLYAYAVETNNVELTTLSDISSKYFVRLRDSEIPLFIEKILDIADELGDKLTDFGITTEKRTAARSKLEDYLKKFGSLNTGKGSKSNAVKTITMLLSKSRAKIKILDKLMLGISEEKPDLYSRYLEAKKIYDKAATHKGENGDQNPDGTGDSAGNTK